MPHKKTLRSIIIIPVFCLLLVFSGTLTAQITENVWFSTQIGIEEIDKRMFNFTEEFRLQILEKNPENWATWTFSFSVNKKLMGSRQRSFGLDVGIGYYGELNTFPRPYIAGFGHPVMNDPLAYNSKGYLMSSLGLPLNFSYTVYDGFSLQVQALPTVSFHSWVPRGFVVNYWHFDWQSVQISPGIRYTHHQWYIGANYRVYHLRKRDPVIFDFLQLRIPEDEPMRVDGYETLDFRKYWIEVGYKWKTKAEKQTLKSKLEP